MPLVWVLGSCFLFQGEGDEPSTIQPDPAPTVAPAPPPPPLPTGDTWVTTGSTGDTAPPPLPPVDVVFVIDNSASMADVQDVLALNSPSLLGPLAARDFHLGVITTDVFDSTQAGLLRASGGHRYLSPDTPNPVVVFSDMIRAGTSGAVDERGIQAVFTLLEQKIDEPANLGFRRDDVPLHIVFVSDENDSTPASVLTDSDAIRWLEELAPEVSVHALVYFTVPSRGGTPGRRYLDLNEALGGYAEELDGVDFNAFLDTLAFTILAP